MLSPLVTWTLMLCLLGLVALLGRRNRKTGGQQ